jgi:outer membrane biosynthesis protein TonB
LIALLAGSGFLVAHYRNSGGLDRFSTSFRTGLASTMAALHRHPNAPAPSHVNQPDVAVSASEIAGAATSGTDVVPVSHSGSLPQSVPAVPAIRPRPETPAETHAPAQSRVASNHDPAKSEIEGGAGVPEASVVVPADEMKDRLISSRVPVYPEGTIVADARRVVVIQAIVSSRGTVEHPHVIEGDPALRRAAIDAASKWRYRPYLLNGEPADVSTTISVDFSGND